MERPGRVLARAHRNRAGVERDRLHSAEAEERTGDVPRETSLPVPGLPGMDFQTTVYDLTDAGLAMVHLDGFPHAPIGVVAVIPAQRRQHLRPEFAFGFVSFLSFLGAMASPDSELAIHDYVESVLRTDTASSLIFTMEGSQLDSDTSIVASAYFENLSIAMLQWLCTKHAEPEADDDDISEVSPAAAVCVSASSLTACGNPKPGGTLTFSLRFGVH